MRLTIRLLWVAAISGTIPFAHAALARAEEPTAGPQVQAEKPASKSAREGETKNRSNQPNVSKYRETEAEREAAREAQRLITREYNRRD